MQLKDWDNKIIFILLLTICYTLMASSSYAQTDDEKISELRQQIEELERQAKIFRGNIAEEQAKAKSLQGEISILNNQIKKIQAQINITSKNIEKTGIEIEGLESNISDKQTDINYKKDTISRLVLSLYKRDQESLIEILIKNTNLSNFLRQAQYNTNISTALFDTITELKEEKTSLEKNKNDLEDKKGNLEFLNTQQRQQNNSLSQTKSGKDTLLTQTKGQEAAYQKRLAEIERQQTLFFTELKELETKIIQGGLYILRVQAQNLPPKGTKLFIMPEDDYRITQGYGCTSYARCNRASGPYGGSPHNGIDLASGYGSPIKTIGDGEIIANGKSDGWGNWVAIKHPPYNLVSVYGHMSAFEFLRVGTQVKAGQVIGYEGNTGHVTGSHVHLSLYKEFFTYVKETNGQLYFNYFDGSINPLNYM